MWQKDLIFHSNYTYIYSCFYNVLLFQYGLKIIIYSDYATLFVRKNHILNSKGRGLHMNQTQKFFLVFAFLVFLINIILRIIDYICLVKYDYIKCSNCSYLFKPKLSEILFGNKSKQRSSRFANQSYVKPKTARCPRCHTEEMIIKNHR